MNAANRKGSLQEAGERAGYCHERYAASLGEFGNLRSLPESGAVILERPIPGTPARDAMACYPLLSCQNWNGLAADLAALEGELVSFAAVVDPFSKIDQAGLRECFPDRLIPFKRHFVVDLSLDRDSRLDCGYLRKTHLRNTRKALRQVQVEICPRPLDWLDDWRCVYQVLVRRHQITGLRGFSRECFAQQFQTPGLVVFRAFDNEKQTTVGMLLWMVQGDVAYYHLGAFSSTGYQLLASYALFFSAIKHFSATGLKWLDLGSGSGVRQEHDGLGRFKKGWATGTRTAYFGGRILDKAAYARLAERSAGTDYFPAYRAGEFS